MRKAIEWFFNLILKQKATKIKQEAFLERQNAVLNYAKAKKKNKKYLDRFSGKKRYQKVPSQKPDK